MSWVSPRNWTAGLLVTPSMMNEISSALSYLIDRTFCLLMVVPGSPSAVANVSIRAIMPVAGTLTAVKSTAGTAAASGTYTYDINKNGTTLYTTQGNRPTRVSGDSTGAKSHTLPDIVTFSAGDVITIDLDAAGSGLVDMQFYLQFNEDA